MHNFGFVDIVPDISMLNIAVDWPFVENVDKKVEILKSDYYSSIILNAC